MASTELPNSHGKKSTAVSAALPSIASNELGTKPYPQTLQELKIRYAWAIALTFEDGKGADVMAAIRNGLKEINSKHFNLSSGNPNTYTEKTIVKFSNALTIEVTPQPDLGQMQFTITKDSNTRSIVAAIGTLEKLVSKLDQNVAASANRAYKQRCEDSFKEYQLLPLHEAAKLYGSLAANDLKNQLELFGFEEYCRNYSKAQTSMNAAANFAGLQHLLSVKLEQTIVETLDKKALPSAAVAAQITALLHPAANSGGFSFLQRKLADSHIYLQLKLHPARSSRILSDMVISLKEPERAKLCLNLLAALASHHS